MMRDILGDTDSSKSLLNAYRQLYQVVSNVVDFQTPPSPAVLQPYLTRIDEAERAVAKCWKVVGFYDDDTQQPFSNLVEGAASFDEALAKTGEYLDETKEEHYSADYLLITDVYSGVVAHHSDEDYTAQIVESGYSQPTLSQLLGWNDEDKEDV